MNHVSWQGKVYCISGRDRRFEPFIETTGYGTPTGLLGINCRHSVFLAWPEHETPQYTQAELGWPSEASVIYEYNKANSEVRRLFSTEIKNGKMTIEEAMATHVHEVVSRVSARLNLRYNRIKHGW